MVFLSLLEIFWPLLARNHGVFPSKTLYVVSEHRSSLFVESTQLPLDTICKDLLAKNTSIILGLPTFWPHSVLDILSTIQKIKVGLDHQCVYILDKDFDSFYEVLDHFYILLEYK